MDIKKIKAIVELIKESGIHELEVTEGEDKLRVSCYNGTVSSLSVAPIYSPAQQTNLNPQLATNPVIINELVTSVSEEAKAPGVSVTSPMVGTFYRSAAPGNPSFVELGQEVKVGQVLCIIEAMKLMNQIEADKPGIIKEILVKDGDPVEYGQVLFILG